MTILEWRNNPERRSMALDMLNQPTMKEILSVVQRELITTYRSRLLKDGFDATIEMGRIHGRQEVFEALRSLTEEIPQPQETIQTTWGVETGETK